MGDGTGGDRRGQEGMGQDAIVYTTSAQAFGFDWLGLAWVRKFSI